MTEATTAISGLVALPDVGSIVAGKFRLEELIGEGGQAWIWRARHVELDSEVALKILRTANSDLTQIQRLREEARAVAKLSHPCIVRVFDLGETPEGHPYFAMEHLDGENLADALARTGKMSPIGAVRLLLPIASAVAAVHAIGVVHRDLKPDNVFLAQGPHGIQPKLLDFGVAKHDGGQQRQARLTEVGAVLGSPAYLSPEQARGQTDIDSRADVWSFCAMLFECVTGTVPFQAPNTHALLFSIAEDTPPTFAELGVDEEELWDIVRRGLEKAPSNRWPNMRTLGRALAQWLSDRNVTSDVTGVVLESTWFNPELVTPPPLMPRRTESVSGDAPAWTKHSFAESHIETRPVEAAPPKPDHRRLAVTLTFFVSMAASAVVLAGASGSVPALRRLEQRTQQMPWGHANPATVAKRFERNGALPHRLDFRYLTRMSAALVPGLPYALAPLPVVPVENLRLVSGPNALASEPRPTVAGSKGAATNPNTVSGTVLPTRLTLASSAKPSATAGNPLALVPPTQGVPAPVATTPGATTPGATTPGATTPGATTPGATTPGATNSPTPATPSNPQRAATP